MGMYIVMTPRKRRQFYMCLHCRNNNGRRRHQQKRSNTQKVSNLIYNQYIVTMAGGYPFSRF